MAGGGDEGDQPEHAGDRDEVVEHRGGGGGGEAVEPVQHAGQQGGQADQRHVWEGDAGEVDGEGEFCWIVGEARGEAEHDDRHGDHAQQGQGEQPEHHDRQGFGGEATRAVVAFAGEEGREGGHEGGIEGALTEQPAEQIGQSVGDEEGIGDRPRAHQGGDQDVPGETQDAADHGPAADGEDAAQHGMGLADARSRRYSSR